MVWISRNPPQEHKYRIPRRVVDEEKGLELISDAGTRGIKSCIISPINLPEQIYNYLRSKVSGTNKIEDRYKKYVLCEFMVHRTSYKDINSDLEEDIRYISLRVGFLEKSKLPIIGYSLEETKRIIECSLIADEVGMWNVEWRPKLKVLVEFDF